MAEDPYLFVVRILNNRVDRGVAIDLRPSEGRAFLHLVVTGKNGSGKSTTLALLHQELQTADLARSLAGPEGEKRFLLGSQPGVLATDWHTRTRKASRVVTKRPHSHFVRARREGVFLPVTGPTNSLRLEAPAKLEQLLVNLRTQVAYAREVGDEAAALGHERALNDIEQTVRGLFDEDVHLVFDRKEIRYRVEIGGRVVDLGQLPDGFLSALEIWADVRAKVDQWPDGAGIVLIDDIEAHLHLALQEKLLPLLVGLFPRVQFVVATHSPAVVASVSGALVYDLSTHQAILSDDLRGIRYGSLMTSHFGLAADFDLDSARRLKELATLHRKENRTAAEEARLRVLAGELSGLSHALAIEVWNELEFGPP